MVLSVHGLLHRKDREHPCLKVARRILTFEEAAVARLERHREFVDLNKVVLLRRPIEHRPRMPADELGFNMVYCGRLSQRKGKVALEVMEAFRRFSERMPRARLVVLGDGSLMKTVRREAEAYNARRGLEVIRVLGAVPDPVPVVGATHVLLGASYAALEAIMQGVAVIGAGFWGYGPITDENLADAMQWNFGDSGGEWEMTADRFLAAIEELHARWSAGRGRERYWRLDRLIDEVHSIESVSAQIERIYEDVLRAPQGILTPAAAGVSSVV
jgi:glycosyltransferase involved in cell wall biosynthesis